MSRWNARDAGALLLLAAGGVVLYHGWQTFWFLTDDAFIAFRYVSNSVAGHGYVWNPEPFRPVEGYTSFLWVVLLDGTWRVFGVQPPDAANWISLAFAFATLAVGAAILMRMRLDRLDRWRLALLAGFIAFLVCNRTFLAWSSSGLETAMFSFFVILWVFAFAAPHPPDRQLWIASGAAAGLALSRPDGLLFALATAAFGAWTCFARRLGPGAGAAAMSPLGLVVVHLAWRLARYGEWLPNTFYAKVGAPWPSSGAIYLASFVLEYALWLPLGVVAWALLQRAPRLLATLRSASPRWIAVATLLLHFAWYTFVVGGDHFEYRIYNPHLVLMFLALVWAVDRLALRPAVALGVAGLWVVLSLPVPWTHWQLTRSIRARKETHQMVVPIASTWPRALAWYADWFDRAQAWLIPRSVCARHQEHKIFWKFQLSQYPPRSRGKAIPSAGFPVLAETTVGVPGWTLPNVVVIDRLGLNDYFVARLPPRNAEFRNMAHERVAPPEYVERFRPNVVARLGHVVVTPREDPLTADEIVEIEQLYRIQ